MPARYGTSVVYPFGLGLAGVEGMLLDTVTSSLNLPHCGLCSPTSLALCRSESPAKILREPT